MKPSRIAELLDEELSQYKLSDAAGKAIVSLLYLKQLPRSNNRYKTTFGTKSACGVCRCVVQIIITALEEIEP